jgi:hypothetical protein
MRAGGCHAPGVAGPNSASGRVLPVDVNPAIGQSLM